MSPPRPVVLVIRTLLLVALVWASTVEECVANASILWQLSASAFSSPATQIADETASQAISHTSLAPHDEVTPVVASGRISPTASVCLLERILSGSRLTRSPPTS